MDTTILLADDHKIIRDGLHLLLSQQPGMRVIAEADNGRRAVELAKELMPDVVVMDISMPELNGIEATRQIVTEVPGSRVIALSMYTEHRFILEMFQAGASGYLIKYSAFEELARAIQAVMNQKRYVSPEIADIVLSEYLQYLQDCPNTIIQLGPREREVLQLLAEGKTTKEVASLLDISANTAEKYRKNIMEKLDLHTIAELTKYAIREGITTLEETQKRS